MNKRIRIIKLIDSLIGPYCVQLISTGKKRLYPLKTRNILILRPGGIGDAVLLIPTIAAIREMFPTSTIHVIAETRNAQVFTACSDIDRVFHYDRLTELISAIRGSYDVVIDTEQWHRLSAVVARLVRAPISFGFSTNERAKLFIHPVPYSQDDYEIDSFLHLIEPLVGKISLDHDRPILAVLEKDRASVEPHLRSLSNRKIITLFPGGSISERRWGSDRFREIAVRLSERGYGIIVVGGKDDIRAGEEIIRDIPGGISVCGKLSLPETAAMLKEASLLVTGDSGIMHLGYAVGTKVVALFGPGIVKKWAPRSSRVIVINKGLPCSPCTKFGYTSTCPIDAECMKRIAVEEVMEKAMILLEQV